MISEPFDPAVEATWIARGRRPDHASILADAWRRFPDLPNEADKEARIARMRDRALALRPVMESMSKAAEEERQARNFAFIAIKPSFARVVSTAMTGTGRCVTRWAGMPLPPAGSPRCAERDPRPRRPSPTTRVLPTAAAIATISSMQHGGLTTRRP